MTVSLAQPPLAAPDLVLPDHTGQTVRLDARRGVGPTVLVFYRGHWCPYCRRYLAKLQAQRAALAELAAEVVAISPEPPATSAALAGDLQLTFPLLSDARGATIDRFGVRNGFTSPTTVLPHAAVFIVDADLLIRFRSIDRNYKKRTTMRAILTALRELRAPQSEDQTSA